MSVNITNNKLISISAAASFLGVSIDTIRRWDSQGLIHSQRPNGKDRYFDPAELSKVKFEKPLTRPEAAQLLKISVSTLRRLEKKGAVTYHKKGGRPVYEKADLEKFLNNEPVQNKTALEKEIAGQSATERKPQVDAPNEERIPVETVTIEEKIEENKQDIINEDKETPIRITLKPWARFPELIVASAIFVLLLGIGYRNIAATNQKPDLATLTLGIKSTLISPTPSPVHSPLPSPTPQPSPSSSPTLGPKKTLLIKTGNNDIPVNIRKLPDTESEIITLAQNGESYEYLSSQSGWFEIRLPDGSTGFILEIFAETQNTEEANTQP